jgi:putative YpdA family bacillithiol system oxidoreductase
VDVAIVGSGPAGLSAALTCVRHGLSYVVLEKEHVLASTVARYPAGKPFMAEPEACRTVSFLPVFSATKEALIDVWQTLVARLALAVRLGEAVQAIERDADGAFALRTTGASYRARRVVLATGLRGTPRTLGVPGESLPKVRSLLEDPRAPHAGQRALVVGGGDSALEAALALAEAGAEVTLAYRGAQFARAKPANRSAIEAAAARGAVALAYATDVAEIGPDHVVLRGADGSCRQLANELVIVSIGADPPVAWLAAMGVRLADRPHATRLGDTAERVEALVGACAACPDDVDGAIARVRGQRDGDETRAAASQVPRRAASAIRRLWPRGLSVRGFERAVSDAFVRAGWDEHDGFAEPTIVDRRPPTFL